MGAIKAITNCNGHNQRYHCEVPKCSWDKSLKRDEEGHGNQPWSHKAALPTNASKASWGYCEYHNNTHPAMIVIVTEASIAAMQAQQMPPWTRRHPKWETYTDWANSCPRSPTMNMGSTTKHTKKNLQAEQKKKPSWHLCHASRGQQLQDKQQIELPGRASETVPSDDRTIASNNNRK